MLEEQDAPILHQCMNTSSYLHNASFTIRTFGRVRWDICW